MWLSENQWAWESHLLEQEEEIVLVWKDTILWDICQRCSIVQAKRKWMGKVTWSRETDLLKRCETGQKEEEEQCSALWLDVYSGERNRGRKSAGLRFYLTHLVWNSSSKKLREFLMYHCLSVQSGKICILIKLSFNSWFWGGLSDFFLFSELSMKGKGSDIIPVRCVFELTWQWEC